MRHFAVSAIGRDRPGIVAAVSEALLAHEGNIEDSQMAILRGHFTMTLIVAAPDGADPEGLARDLAAVKDALALEALSVSEVSDETDEAAAADPVPSHIVSVYGVDHPGIVHAVSVVLAAQGVSITDLQTRLAAGAEGEPVYAMMLEVALPEGADAAAVERGLAETARRQQVELSFRPLEQDAL